MQLTKFLLSAWPHLDHLISLQWRSNDMPHFPWLLNKERQKTKHNFYFTSPSTHNVCVTPLSLHSLSLRTSIVKWWSVCPARPLSSRCTSAHRSRDTIAMCLTNIPPPMGRKTKTDHGFSSLRPNFAFVPTDRMHMPNFLAHYTTRQLLQKSSLLSSTEATLPSPTRETSLRMG